MGKCVHCGDAGAEKTTVEVSRLLRTSKLAVDLCRECHAALVEYIEHGDVVEPEEDGDEEGEDEEEDD